MEIVLTTTVNAPLAQVFDVFSDVTCAQGRLSNVVALEVLTTGPVGVGTRWRETRRMLGQEAVEEMAISAFDPPHSYQVIAESHGARYCTSFRFEPRESGATTQVTLAFSAQAVTLLAKLLSITGVIFRSATEKALQADLEDLKRASEDGGA